MFTTQSALAVPLPAGVSDRILVTQTTGGITTTLFDTGTDPATSLLAEGGSETFTLIPGSAVFIPGVTVGLVESDGTVSDLFTTSADGLTAIFTSDVEGGPALPPPTGAATPLTETGELQDISTLVLTAAALDGGVSISIQSDLDAPTPPGAVPEPGTWLLFGTGFLGLLGYAWRCRA